MDFPQGTSGKEPASQCRRLRDANLIPGWEDAWRRAWQQTPAFLPGEVNGQGSLAGYCLWGHTGLDKTGGP